MKMMLKIKSIHAKICQSILPEIFNTKVSNFGQISKQPLLTTLSLRACSLGVAGVNSFRGFIRRADLTLLILVQITVGRVAKLSNVLYNYILKTFGFPVTQLRIIGGTVMAKMSTISYWHSKVH